MAARGDGVEGDERVWVVVVGRGEPGWRLSVEGEFGGGNGGGRELFWAQGRRRLGSWVRGVEREGKLAL